MLSDKNAMATVGVRNLESARKFYEQTLGLTKVMENEEVVAFKSGGSTLFVYRSQYAGTNKATSVTWVAEEVEDIVKALKARIGHASLMLSPLTRRTLPQFAGRLQLQH